MKDTMTNKRRTSEVSIAKTMKIIMGQQQRNVSLQTPVQRPSPGDHAAYLHTEMPTSILTERPHDDGSDEQCEANIESQC